MVDRENVIAALEHCATVKTCDKCPMGDECTGTTNAAMAAAAELLKAQEARVMTLEEVEDALDTVVWVDRPLLDNSSDEYALIDAYSRKTQIVELRYPFCDKGYRERADYATYGRNWRCWTSRPTDEQREAVNWDA